jgi:DNA-binding SARP family transcriptional activator
MAARETEPLSYHVLGGFRLKRGSRWVDAREWHRTMPQRVVRFLLAHRTMVPEDELLEAFWRDRDPVAAKRCLTVGVSCCRAVIGPDGIEVTDRSYRLVLRAGDTVDADSYEAAASAALESRRPRIEALERAAALWTGEPLPEDRYADWATAWRDRLTDRHRELLAAIADDCAAAGLHAAALRAACRMVEADPLDEGAHRRVMAAYVALGQRTRALEQYVRCRRGLVERIGIEPSAETAALHRHILAGTGSTVAAA